MRDAARAAAAFAAGLSRAEFEADDKTLTAVVKKLEIVGEAAFKLHEQTRLGIPELPWDEIIGMRHVLVHAYYDIDVELVWKTVQEDLPALLGVLARYAPDDDRRNP